MTRESKLALVLGFSLMLFVLILVSDHMAARNAPLVATNTTERTDIGVPPIPPPGGGDDRIVMQGPDGAMPIDPTRPAIVDSQAGGQGEQTPTAIVMGGSLNGGTGGDGVGSLSGGQHPETARPQVPETPSVKTYTIRKGDTFAAIAAAEYKKRSLGDKLAAFNGIKPSKLKIGDTIKLPSITELDPTAAAPTRLAGEDTSKPAEQVAATGPSFRPYKVKEGDTLYRIAERELGNGSRWKELRSANNELLKGGSDLHPGMQIRIPEKQLAGASTDA